MGSSGCDPLSFLMRKGNMKGKKDESGKGGGIKIIVIIIIIVCVGIIIMRVSLFW